MKIKRVVTSFIIGRHNSGDDVKLLLLQRSGKVNTYQGKWAGISGSIEEDDVSPLERSYIEIEQETRLDRKDITLIISGLEMAIKDDNLDTEWHIYPFLFEMKDSQLVSITIDFEHSTYKWINPKDLSTYDTVPRLSETFARVYIPQQICKLISNLQTDREMGAREMSEMALDVLIQAVQESQITFGRLCLVGYYAVQSRQSMKAAMESSLARVLTNIQKRLVAATSKFDLASITRQEVENEKSSGCLRLEKQVLGFKACLDGYEKIHILTLSYSSTTAIVLKHWLSQLPLEIKVRITVLESRPLFEGVKLAKILSLDSHENVHIEIASDACVGIFAQRATHVVIGADRISADGDVLNKVGSLGAAILGRRYGAKVVVVSGQDKIVEKKSEENEENESSEMTEAWKYTLPATTRVRNKYFEWVEADLIDDYVTEGGKSSRKSIFESWMEKRDQALVFQDL
ncbi:Methylthioribose-1-phosphate isomerase [Neolecta irregularis DAH-3]|uniref:Methylthioribose-1-phosphate isomerase n=1 Tax=Neolecta irregularis (strain DAH-3) TaxID=1198029 RepID=A0A1U7LTK5_NEOID|nr:Methylthioribose-1-phosphate isomerase [Neolecta irregularis DAH-3]|eukprot:OLL25997.1 Methylthioribose-1-phosphate isomerase [Neolecta irregularis DAH-3]